MSDATVIAPILTSAVGLVGALVAGLSVYFNYKGRHNQFRQVVYGRQMDAYFGIAESMANLYTAAQNALAFSNPRLRGEDARQQFRQDGQPFLRPRVRPMPTRMKNLPSAGRAVNTASGIDSAGPPASRRA